ncbi:hypothetical protein [Streptomyces lavendofoliae]|nr:hypothetical protein [Streptomyces lavendofoliae]
MTDQITKTAEESQVTAEERLERLRASLSGARAQTRGGRRMQLNQPGNILAGAMMHAAARQEQDLELTDLEQQLLNLLGQYLPEEEIPAFGRVYREAAALGGIDIFPEQITGRSIESGYSLADFAADLPALSEKIMAQPNVRVVDVSKVAEGETFDTEEFTAAVGEYGRGITLHTSSAMDGMRAAPTPVRLHLHQFKCKDESNEGSPDDEIYWGLSAGSDTGVRQSGRTRTYTNIDAGEMHRIDSGTYLFNGTVNQYLTAEVMCWEEDHSGPDWMQALRRGLADFAYAALDLAARLQEAGGDDAKQAAGWVAFAAVAAGILEWILSWWTNNDDLVAEHVLGYTRGSLIEQSVRPWGGELWYDFNGGGSEGWQHLSIRCSADFPSGSTYVHGPYLWKKSWPELKGTPFETGQSGQLMANVPGSETDVYIFRNSDCAVFMPFPGFLKNRGTIAQFFPGLVGTDFTERIHSACRVPGSSTDMYFFRREQYLRYNTATHRIVNGPMPVMTGWPGLVGASWGNITAGTPITAAVTVPGSSTDVYLFRGYDCLRYHAFNERIVEGPWPSRERWPDLFEVGGFERMMSVDSAINATWPRNTLTPSGVMPLMTFFQWGRYAHVGQKR